MRLQRVEMAALVDALETEAQQRIFQVLFVLVGVQIEFARIGFAPSYARRFRFAFAWCVGVGIAGPVRVVVVVGRRTRRTRRKRYLVIVHCECVKITIFCSKYECCLTGCCRVTESTTEMNWSWFDLEWRSEWPPRWQPNKNISSGFVGFYSGCLFIYVLFGMFWLRLFINLCDCFC